MQREYLPDPELEAQAYVALLPPAKAPPHESPHPYDYFSPYNPLLPIQPGAYEILTVIDIDQRTFQITLYKLAD